MCVRGVVLHASWEWSKVTSTSMRNRKLRLKVYQKRSKK
jgi:hypothetical protein